MSNATPKDHYVPQFYLDNFATEGPGRKNPHIYQYMNEEIVSPRIKDVASEKHFYTFEDKYTQKPNREIDDLFQKIETEACKPLKKIIESGCVNITDQELEILSVFIAFLVIRTPGFMKAQEDLQSEAIKEFNALESINIDALKQKLKKAGINLTKDELIKYQKFVLEKEYDISFENSKGYFFGHSLMIACELMEIYYNKKHWHLLINEDYNIFVTSDNPVTIYRPVYVPAIHNAGYGTGTLVIPISPKYALLLRDYPLKQKENKINSKINKKINLNAIQFADKYIFSNIKSKKIHNLYKNTELKKFQKTKVTRVKWAPYVFMGPPAVPEEFFH